MDKLNDIRIIFDDKNIILAQKPAGMPCQADKTNDADLLSILSEKFSSEIFLVHRLDRPVGGIMVFAKNKKACGFLSGQIQNKTFKKTYLCVACGIPSKKEGALADYIIKNQRLNLTKPACKNMPGAKLAELSYKVISSCETDSFGLLSLLEIDLKTGRHHQIRFQLSNANFPLWGDTKYNGAFKKSSRRNGNNPSSVKTFSSSFVKIALFASSVEFINPSSGKNEKYTVSPPDEFPFNAFPKDSLRCQNI